MITTCPNCGTLVPAIGAEEVVDMPLDEPPHPIDVARRHRSAATADPRTELCARRGKPCAMRNLELENKIQPEMRVSLEGLAVGVVQEKIRRWKVRRAARPDGRGRPSLHNFSR